MYVWVPYMCVHVGNYGKLQVFYLRHQLNCVLGKVSLWPRAHLVRKADWSTSFSYEPVSA